MDNQASVSPVRTAGPAELVFRTPHPRLAGLVLAYTGQDWTVARPLLRRITALATVVLVIDFQPPVRTLVTNSRVPGQDMGASPVTGMRDRPMTIEQAGRMHGLTVQLTAPGAHALFGVPLRELTDSYAGFHDLLGTGSRHLTDRLAEAPDWPARFRLLDSYLIARIGAGPELPAQVRHAWQRLSMLSGDVRIGALADEVGWSRQHLNARFRREIGLSPKSVARIARLQRSLSLMYDTGPLSWADAAAAAGYADQPHLNRDFRMLTGCSPTEFRTLLADWRGVLTGNYRLTHRPRQHPAGPWAQPMRTRTIRPDASVTNRSCRAS
ncbi:helix-turn-helix domain-containing protein [Streptomyces luteireticuli]|uniref:Helix-turn-helix domain-containing protein n=1 Tax=Streptomyces luteireticuli TaxID=173858 RepID=A0ABP3IDS9_9ACTN